MSFKKVLLVKPSKTLGYGFLSDIIPLGLEYIAAYIQNHVQRVDAINLAKYPKELNYYLRKLKPDLVGISLSYTIEHSESLEIAKEVKQFGASVAVGGYHATGLAEELASHPDIDFVIRGEGEKSMLELVQKGSAEEVKGISYSKNEKTVHNPPRPLIKDLDSIPHPARSLRKCRYRSSLHPGVRYDAIMTSRGCWGNCKFCCEPMMCRGIQRYRKPEEVIKELEAILRFYKENKMAIQIADPNFCGNPRIAEKLCDCLIEFKSTNKIEIAFMGGGRADIIGNNEAIAQKLGKAGLDVFLMGIETPNERHLELMGKNMTKKLQEKAVKSIRDNGGKVCGTFIVGLPFQTEKDIWECFEYAKMLEMDFTLFLLASPFPGTELYKELKLKELLIEESWDKYDYLHPVFKHEFLTTEQVRKILLKIQLRIANDLFIPYEHRDIVLGHVKKQLYRFAEKHMAMINSLWQTHNFSYQDLSYLEEFINPGLKKFTEEKGIHNILEISRFLKILGAQKIQITLHVMNKPIVSWIIKTTKDTVEYIDATRETEKDASIVINIPMENMIKTKSLFDMMRKIIKNTIKDNKGFKAKLNFMRFFIACGTEILICSIKKIYKKR